MTNILDVAGATLVAVGVAIVFGIGAGLIVAGVASLAASWSLAGGRK